MIVEAATPSAVTGPVPIMLELATSAAPALKTTVPPVKETGVSIERVFVSALVEESEQLESPAVVLTLHEPKLLFVPETENVGVEPATGLL